MTTQRGMASREKILATAELLFSEHGFDKTTVDSISAEAGVNKALIYYHFDSKTDILKAVYDRLFNEIDTVSKGKSTDLHEQLMAELTGAKKFAPGMVIMLMEALKTEGGSDALIEFGQMVLEHEHPDLKQLPAAEYQRALMSQFFTGFIPFAIFSVMKERWCKYHGINNKEAEEDFVKIFIEKNLDAH